MPPPRSRAEVQHQKEKLASSYHELLEEFSSKDLRNVGNYNLGRLIGKGSFGKVYLATHKLTNGSKVVLKSSSKEDGNLAREIHHHRQFLHPHIARLYEVIVTENLVWLALEYCPGDELYNYLLRNGPISLDKVQKIFTQLVGAVAYVHGKSCVHRDLKLENILLDKNENVKLCDFGFTREYEGKASYLQTFCGTVCYSAPEMLKGEKYAGEKVDVWSLGIILYALIAGELPFDEDDDQDTKRRILTEEPKFNDRFSEDSKSLISLLLSKRPLIRPSLSDILAHPFLAEHAPAQQAILKLTRPSPFSTPLEKTTLERMKSAGVNIDHVIESVLAQKCDVLAGWWALLIEKEERKEKRRDRKRREKEAEAKNLRRLSAASSRLEHISAALMEVEEEGQSTGLEEVRNRGRGDRRSLPTPKIVIPELPKLPESSKVESPDSIRPPPPVEKDSVRSSMSSQPRPVPPPKENRRSHASTLQLSTSTPELLRPNGIFRRRTRRQHPHPFMSQLASLKHWFVESAKRARSPHAKAGGNTGNQNKSYTNKSSPPKNSNQTSNQMSTPTNPSFNRSNQTQGQTKRASNASSFTPSNTSNSNQPRSSSLSGRPRPLSTASHHRNSLSPSALTPRSSYRRSSAGLRGRKSTSSSVSSIRSIHHAHSHSKASSASSNSMDTVSTPTGSSGKNISLSRSPHNSLKVLPTTPNASSRFPNNIRLVRGMNNATGDSREVDNGNISNFNERAPMMSSPSSGLVFARRKRSAFKGPMLGHPSPLFGGALGTSRPTEGAASRDGGDQRPGTRKSQIIEEEEDEMIEDDDEYEDVDRFSPTDDKEMDFEEAQERLDDSVLKTADEAELVNETTQMRELTIPALTPSPEPNVDPLRPPRSSSLRSSPLAENRPGTSDSTSFPPVETDSKIGTKAMTTENEQETPTPPEKD